MALKIIFMGTPEFAVPTLEALKKKDILSIENNNSISLNGRDTLIKFRQFY